MMQSYILNRITIIILNGWKEFMSASKPLWFRGKEYPSRKHLWREVNAMQHIINYTYETFTLRVRNGIPIKKALIKYEGEQEKAHTIEDFLKYPYVKIEANMKRIVEREMSMRSFEPEDIGKVIRELRS